MGARGLALAVLLLLPAQGWAQTPVLDTHVLVRARGEAFDGRAFGASGPGDDAYVLWRALADLELQSADRWTIHLQLGWHDQTGRATGPAPTDEGELDVRQAYAEARIGENVRLKAGRQELAFGSSRLVSARDGPNLRRAFDAAMVTHQTGPWRTRAFVARPVEDRPGAFDDRRDRDQLFAGVYATRADERLGLDLYYLVLDRASARFGGGAAAERRHSLGVRAFGRTGALDYNLELVGQWGEFGNARIRAWTAASDVGMTLDGLPFEPRLGVKANITSGDHDPADRQVGTFNPLFPNLSYFNDAALLAPQNHTDLHPSLTLLLTPTLETSIGADWFWKSARADDVYRGPGLPLNARSVARYVGRQVDWSLAWQATEELEVRVSYVRFDVGPALRATGGEDVDFGMLSIQRRF